MFVFGGDAEGGAVVDGDVEVVGGRFGHFGADDVVLALVLDVGGGRCHAGVCGV